MPESQSKPPSLIGRALRATWAGIDFSRRLLLNLLFVLVMLFLLLALFARAPELQPRSALVIAPAGMLVEQYSVDPLSRAIGRLTGEQMPETQLRDLLRAIEAAKDDERIERIVLRPDALAGAGFAALREVGQALSAFRESGKQVVAYADYMEQRQYYLAAFADEVYLHPSGLFWLEGLASYRSYFREALQDKLGADVHLFRAGEFKSFGEQYTRDGPSPEALEADRYWIGDLWNRFLADIAVARSLDPITLQQQIDTLPERLAAANGDMAALAVDQGLIDELLSEDAFEQRMAERGAADDELGFRQVDLDTYLAQLGGVAEALAQQVAVVVAEGEILDGEQPAGTIGGRSTAALLREAREDDQVAAVVIRIDSPGGSPFASEQIRRELELIREAGKPVIASMGNVAASGGYWIAMGGDAIYADPSTITGSIGVFGMLFSVPETLGKIGVRVGGVATTRIAGGFDPRLPLKPEVGAVMQSVVDANYREFVSRAAAARGTSEEQLEAVARGRVWSGAQAAERGLVDTMGGLQDAVAAAAERAELGDDYAVRYIETAPSTFEQFLLDFGQTRVMRALAVRLDGGMLLDGRSRAELEPLLKLLDPKTGPSFRTVLHCFCRL